MKNIKKLLVILISLSLVITSLPAPISGSRYLAPPSLQELGISPEVDPILPSAPSKKVNARSKIKRIYVITIAAILLSFSREALIVISAFLICYGIVSFFLEDKKYGVKIDLENLAGLEANIFGEIEEATYDTIDDLADRTAAFEEFVKAQADDITIHERHLTIREFLNFIDERITLSWKKDLFVLSELNSALRKSGNNIGSSLRQFFISIGTLVGPTFSFLLQIATPMYYLDVPGLDGIILSKKSKIYPTFIPGILAILLALNVVVNISWYLMIAVIFIYPAAHLSYKTNFFVSEGNVLTNLYITLILERIRKKIAPDMNRKEFQNLVAPHARVRTLANKPAVINAPPTKERLKQIVSDIFDELYDRTDNIDTPAVALPNLGIENDPQLLKAILESY
ncbi:MAG: hypothetical protein ABII23_09070 [bacterium]